MKHKQIFTILILLLLLSACAIAPASTPEVTDTPAPAETPDVPPEPTPEPTPNIKYYEREYDVPWPFTYETVFPSVYPSVPGSSRGTIASSCKVYLLPTDKEPQFLCNLEAGATVELLAVTGHTYDQYEWVEGSWYLICTGNAPNNILGWVKAENITPADAASETSCTCRYAYTQGVVIDGCELSLLPGGEAAWALPKNYYVEILAACTPEGSEEEWLYIFIGSFGAEFHQALWVEASEIKQYNRENMYDILNNLSVAPDAKCYWRNGTTVLDEGDRTNLCLDAYEEGVGYWLGGPGGVYVRVENFEDIVFPEPID